MTLRRCAASPVQPEFSLCGEAEDGFESGDLEEEFAIALPHESITCPRCCAAIREVKALRNRLAPRQEK
jgi:hypothetical protein